MKCQHVFKCDNEAEYRWQGKHVCQKHFSYSPDSAAATSARIVHELKADEVVTERKIRITREEPKAQTCANPRCDSTELTEGALVMDAGEMVTVLVCKHDAYHWDAVLGSWPASADEEEPEDERSMTGVYRDARLSGYVMIHKGTYWGQYMGGSEAGAWGAMRNLRRTAERKNHGYYL